MAEMSKVRAKEIIQMCLDGIQALRLQPSDSVAFQQWQRNTREAIRNCFASHSPEAHVEDFEKIRFRPNVAIRGDQARNERLSRQAVNDGLDSATALLKSLLDEIEMYWES